jgi:hypothetical protein
MKKTLLSLFFLVCMLLSKGQFNSIPDPITITFNKGQTKVRTNENGELIINVSPKNVAKFKSIGQVRYSDFDAKGDGKTEDMKAIAATHAFANEHDLKVKADDEASYYIGGQERTAFIETDTDFGSASFIIDDTDVKNIIASIFRIRSKLDPITLDGINMLIKNQKKIPVSVGEPCLISVTDDNVKRYKRFGLNQNNGHSQTDIFMVDENGIVDPKTPIIWDFDTITEISVIRIDQKPLKITGGRFTTIANQAASEYNYYSRNIEIRRSNVILDGLEHRITGEIEHGAPYRGFINVQNCYNVTVKNTLLTGHKTYKTIGNAGKPVSMGSYDINLNRALRVTFMNCLQTNDINDNTYWGIMGTNYCKNLLLDNCTFSRFDAHMGVTNASIINSKIGYMGVKAIGHGTFTIENTTVRSNHFLYFRQDYGSSWQGDFVIRNCTFIPTADNPNSISLIEGYNSGQHDFGYTCYMPEKIAIENLKIQDVNVSEDYQGPAIFSDFNPEMIDNSYQEAFPYVLTKEVKLKNVTSSSGKSLRISDNPYMFRDVKITTD